MHLRCRCASSWRICKLSTAQPSVTNGGAVADQSRRGSAATCWCGRSAIGIQELLFGGLPKWAARRLAGSEEGFDGDEAASAPIEPRLKPGARLVREWHGRAHSVIALDDGFEFEGRRYRSLTQIAHAITGARWSGPRFFGLADRRAGRERSEGRGRTGALREDPIDDGADERERENATNARASPHANGGRRSASLASGGGGRA